VKPYTRIFKADHDKALELGSTCLMVFLALCRIQSDAPPEKKGLFQAGAARIMRHCGLSRRAVQDGMKRLAAEGLIEIKSGRRKDRKTDHEENQITLKGSAQDALGSARDEGIRCARKKKASKEAKKEGRFAGSEAIASPASGNEKSPAANPCGWPSKSTHHPEQKTTNQPAA
jgi:hypothetical protein